jgi:hypothetical protein
MIYLYIYIFFFNYPWRGQGGEEAVVRIGDVGVRLLPSARPELIPWGVAPAGSPIAHQSPEVLGAYILFFALMTPSQLTFSYSRRPVFFCAVQPT